MRAVSATLIAASQAQESGEVFGTLARLSHPSWAGDIRLANDTQAVTHGGQVYQPFPFEVALPDEEDEGLPVMRFAADNVSREIMDELRSTASQIAVSITWVLASQPDTVEAGPIEGILQGAEGDAQTISGVLALEPVLDEPFGYRQLTPQNAPGLF